MLQLSTVLCYNIQYAIMNNYDQNKESINV